MERINLRYWGRGEIERLMPERFIARETGNEIFKALESEKIILLYGPRQGGKTSLLGWIIHKLLEQGIPPSRINYASMDFLDLHPLIQDTRKLVKLLREEGEEGTLYLFVDEVQRLKNAGIVLKQIYDIGKDIRIIATGSSTLKIREEVREHLTGRKVELVLYPFSFLEFLRAKDAIPENRIRRHKVEEMEEFIHLYQNRLSTLWQEYLYTGGYPEIVLSEGKRNWLYSSLFSTYLERDVGSLIRTANYQKLQDFVRLAAAETGSIYNRESVSRTLGRDSRTIERFEDILTITFVLYRLTPFYTRIRRELSKMPRFYFVDTGFRNYLIGTHKKEAASGALLENGVVSEAIKAGRYSLHWWRTKGGAEVDLVIRGKERIPVEIKAIREERPKLTRSFTSFLNTYTPPYALFLTHNYVAKAIHKNTRVYFLPAYALGFLTF